MSRNVRCGLIQARNVLESDRSLPAIKKAMVDKHLKLIEQAARKKVKVLCLQELPLWSLRSLARWSGMQVFTARTFRAPLGARSRLEDGLHLLPQLRPAFAVGALAEFRSFEPRERST